MFPCPSPKGSNHAGLYLNRAGDLVDRNGALWGRRGTMAMDSLPESIRAPHVPASDADEDDEERGVEGRADIKALRKYLHENTGLSWDVIEDACTLAEQAISERGEVTDELPTSGPGGMRNASNEVSREGGEKVFKSAGRFEKRPPLGTKSSSEERSMLGEATYRASSCERRVA